MTYYYSAQENAFYLPDLHGENIPLDAVEISNAEHSTLMSGQAHGKRIAADENGYPILQDPPPAQPYVPQQVTIAQGKASLIMAGLWQDVLDAVEAIEDPVEKALAEVGLNDATHWERSSPMLNMLATALGLSEEDLDDLFIQASQIQL